MNLNKFIAPLLIGGAILFLPHKGTKLNAQDTSSIEVSINKSSLFRDANKTFFNGSSISVLYANEIIENVDGYVELAALSSIFTDNKNSGLDKYLISIFNLNAGFYLNVVKNRISEFSIGIGANIRNRKEVGHTVSLDYGGLDLTSDDYINTIDYGGAFQLKFMRFISPTVSVGARTGISIYNKGNSVLDAGVTIAKHF